MPTGHTSDFTLATTGLSLPIIDVTPPNEQCEDIAEPHLGLALGDNIPYSPGDLVEGDEFTLLLATDHNTSLSTRVVETCTWTKPIAAGNTTADTWVFTGYIKSVQEGSMRSSERSTITIVVKVASNVVKTAGT